jgi:hypothetical protein
MVSEIVKYRNRYDDEFEFKELSNGNIQWSGHFEYCRYGMPNDYTLAWEAFQEEYGGMSYEDFKKNVHTYDEVKKEYVFKDLLPLITSKTDIINMVDPSGGPFISEGMDLGLLNKEWSDKIVIEFISNEDGYEIVVE